MNYTKIEAVSLAGHDQAKPLLNFLDQNDIEPQVATVALVMAAGMLIGHIATDPDNLRSMSMALRNIFKLRAQQCFNDCGCGHRMNN
jgi:hypothetical protein